MTSLISAVSVPAGRLPTKTAKFAPGSTFLTCTEKCTARPLASIQSAMERCAPAAAVLWPKLRKAIKVPLYAWLLSMLVYTESTASSFATMSWKRGRTAGRMPLTMTVQLAGTWAGAFACARGMAVCGGFGWAGQTVALNRRPSNHETQPTNPRTHTTMPFNSTGQPRRSMDWLHWATRPGVTPRWVSRGPRSRSPLGCR